MALLKVIEWSDNSHNTLVYKIDTKKNVIARGSALTVREGQAAVFCDKGRMADVFLPGYYKLDTDSLPVLTALLSWKYGFETPFKSEYILSAPIASPNSVGVRQIPSCSAIPISARCAYAATAPIPSVSRTRMCL